MRHQSILSLCPFMFAACGSGDRQMAVCQGGDQIKAAEANNYSLSFKLHFPPVTAIHNTDLTFDWSQATKDNLRKTMDPKTELNLIMIILWNSTLERFEKDLAKDELLQSEMTGPLVFYPKDGKTSAKLSEFSYLTGVEVPFKNTLEYFDVDLRKPEENFYTLIGCTGTTVGQGFRIIQSFKLDKASTNQTVAITARSAELDFTADLHSARPTSVPVGTADISLDWDKLGTNAMGNDFFADNITSASIGQYSQSPAELENDNFLNLDTVAKRFYQRAIEEGTSVDFSRMKDGDGNPFTGIDDDGTWLVALRCGSCKNPAPLYLSILKPCSLD
jgi:hypothetical protein